MQGLRAAVVLLLVAAAWAPPGSAGTAEDPELTDAAGDQVVQRTVPSQVPPIPSVTDDAFGDVDLVAAWFEERDVDCVGAATLDCPRLTLMVKTTAGWTSGTLTGNFTLRRGPTSYASSNATFAGADINFTVQGTTVSGIANATADVGPDGLRIRFPIPRIGAVGGDVVTGLTLTATRTNLGFVTDPAATQDDATGTDTAGPGAAYTMARPDPVSRWGLRVVSIDGAGGASATLTERKTLAIVLEVTNLGTDRAPYVLNDRAEGEPLPQYRGFGDSGELDPLQSARHSLNVSMEGMQPGAARILFFIDTPQPLATATITYAPLAADRDVKPAGLTFLSPATEAVGFDDAFDGYGELALLALIVLVVILVIFLLVALAPSTLAGTAAPEAPPVAAAETAPAGVLPAAVATIAPPNEEAPKADPASATPGGALAIDSVTHAPEAPEEGETVATEVVLRNPGPTRQVRVVLAVDEHDDDEKAVTLPARATKTVRLSWTAGPGENRVRVRVLPA